MSVNTAPTFQILTMVGFGVAGENGTMIARLLEPDDRFFH
jgi:hypothetical protein